MRRLPVANALPGTTTAPGAFTPDNPELRAGAFDYRLFQGGYQFAAAEPVTTSAATPSWATSA
jgi:hypothetical protein